MSWKFCQYMAKNNTVSLLSEVWINGYIYSGTINCDEVVSGITNNLFFDYTVLKIDDAPHMKCIHVPFLMDSFNNFALLAA